MSSKTKHKRRSQAFFGLHFDFHCRTDDQSVGGRTTPPMVRRVLRTVRPDYVQIDGKGHPGFCSYPTRISTGNPAPGIVRDQLAVWRAETRRAGVPLVLHYSGVLDEAALRRNPDWTVVGKDGKPHPGLSTTSVFSPYVDELLIPQLRELAVDYSLDAVWVDGEVWAVALDWSRWSQAAWRRQHGKKPLLRDPADPLWTAFVDHCREGFRAYLRSYVDAIHAAAPDFEIASNWAFSTHMPEAVSAAVDFISGDFSPAQSVQSARIQSRFLMLQGKPWDLMAWGFGYLFDGPNVFVEKSAVQLQQEAALVLSLGGGFQIYTQQQRDGSVASARLPVLAEVAKFCRDREALCHRAVAVDAVAVLSSHEDWRLRSGGPFPGAWPGLLDLEGVLRLCLDARCPTGVLMDHLLEERLATLRILVLPDCHHLAPATRERLLAWLRAGGRMLVLGPHALSALAIPGLPITADGDIREGARQLRDPERAGGTEFAMQKGHWQAWSSGRGSRELTRMHDALAPESACTPGAVSCRVGKGRLVAVSTSMGNTYLEHTSSASRALVAGWLRNLDPVPPVEVTGAGRIEIAVMRKDGTTRIHLTNLEGPYDARHVIAWDHIPPIGPLDVRVRLPVRGPMHWEPSGERLPVKRTRDGVVVRVPGFAIHGALVFSH